MLECLVVLIRPVKEHKGLHLDKHELMLDIKVWQLLPRGLQGTHDGEHQITANLV